jgi:hypothetical protein
VVVPVVAANLSGVEGEAEVSTLGAGPTLDVELRPSGSAMSGGLGLAVMVAQTRTRGFASRPLEGRADAQTRVVPMVNGGIAYALSTRVGLELAFGVGFAVPALEVRFSGREVARWGAPYVTTGAGVRVGF